LKFACTYSSVLNVIVHDDEDDRPQGPAVPFSPDQFKNVSLFGVSVSVTTVPEGKT
jgi:hypothetical protein